MKNHHGDTENTEKRTPRKNGKSGLLRVSLRDLGASVVDLSPGLAHGGTP
jgi:hypothetical protein